MEKTERRHDLDNIRWVTVLLVVVYHVFYLYNAEGVFGGLGSFAPVQYQDVLLYAVYPWFMVLLFLVAGIVARYSLQRRRAGEFLRERTVKLLVPSTLGLLVFHWTTGWFYLELGGGMDAIPAALRYPVAALSGTGPLWFAQTLWLFSVLLVPLRRLDAGERVYHLCGRANAPALLACGLLLWGGSQVLNLPVLTTYRFGVYGTAYLLGYFVFSHETVQAKVERLHLPLLAAALALGGVYVAYWFGADYTDAACLQSLFTGVYLWAAVLAILGCGRAWWNKTSPLAAYCTRAGFGVYVLHYAVAVRCCWYLKQCVWLPVPLIYLLACGLTLALTLALYELVRRVPVLRFCVLGIHGEKNAPNRSGAQSGE